MKFLLDTHVHLYPCFSLATVVDEALKKNGGVSCGLVYTRSLSEQPFEAVVSALEKIYCEVVSKTPLDCTLCLPGATVSLFSGAQLVTRERIEVLSLLHCDLTFNGLSLQETLRAISDAGGIPVLPWSPGKWLGARGALLTQQHASFPMPIFLGDIAQRSSHRTLRLPGVSDVFPVLGGSDPLSFKGEESQVGRLWTALTLPGERESFIPSAHDVLHSLRHLSPNEMAVTGERNSFWEASSRWVRAKREKKLKNQEVKNE